MKKARGAPKKVRRPLECFGAPLCLVAIKELLPLAKRVAKRICKAAGIGRGSLKPVVFDQKFFADGELMSRKPLNAAFGNSRVIYLDCPRFPTINDGIMNTVLTLDAIGGTGAGAITHIPLYFPYARQDKRKPGEPLSWVRVAKMMRDATRRLDRIIVVELHTEQHEGVFDGLRFSQMRGHRIFAEYFAPKYRRRAKKCVVVSPDAGGVGRAEKFAAKLFPGAGMEVGHMTKRRPNDNVTETISYTGTEELAGKTIFLYDDMIDTGGTIAGSAKLLKSRGAKKVVAVAMHGLFNNTALEDMRANGVDEVVVSESIPRAKEWLAKEKKFVTIVPLDNIIAKVIIEQQRVGGSATSLFV